MIATAMRAIIDAAARNSALAEEGANPGVLPMRRRTGPLVETFLREQPAP
jgi:hypothetical protein